jgi:hypothetical protein
MENIVVKLSEVNVGEILEIWRKKYFIHRTHE